MRQLILKPFLVFLLGMMLVPALAQSGGGGALNILLLGQPSTDESSVSLSVIVLDEVGTVVPDLTVGDFTIADGEDAALKPDQVLPEFIRPTALFVVVNLSRGSDLALIQNTLRAYFSSYYRQGDTTFFYILDDTRPANSARVESPANLSAINRLIDSLVLGATFYDITSILASVAAEAQAARTENPAQNVHALYVASFLYRNAEATASTNFAAARIPFSVVQAHSVHANATTAMAALATSGNGRFVDNRDGLLLDTNAESGEAAAIQDLRALYDTLEQGRLIYRIVYTPERTGSTPERTAELRIATEVGQQGRLPFAYVWQFLPPDVTIVSEINREILAQGDAAADDAAETETLFAVTVRIAFPDGIARNINRVTLEVLDITPGVEAVGDSVRVACLRVISTPLADADGDYTISCQIRDYIVPGSFTPVQVQVNVIDEYGYERSVVGQGSISVLAPTPIPPTLTPRPTAVPTLTPAERSELSGLSTANLLLLLTGVAILLLFLVILFMLRLLLRYRNNRPVRIIHQPVMMAAQVPQQPLQTTMPVTAPVDVFSEQKIKAEQEHPIYARLFVLSGLNAGQILIDREEFVIGRSLENGCHFEIPEPFVHARHCLIKHSRGNFTITDLGSKNGTFVDGERLPVNREVPVPMRSEISITKNITLELREPDAEYVPPQGMQTMEQRAGDTTTGELRFKPMLEGPYSGAGGSLPQKYDPFGG